MTGLDNLPKSKWWSANEKEPGVKQDMRDIETAILQSFLLRPPPCLTWIDVTSVKVAATPDSPAALMMTGVPNILHPGQMVTGGLSDGRYRCNVGYETMDFDLAADLWGTEKASQWYAVYAIAGNMDSIFILKNMPFMRFKSQGSQVISLGNLVTPATGIGYGFTTDELVGTKIYILSGASAGLMREIIANNNNNDTGGTITYGGDALTMSVGDWFVVLPATNFRLIGEIFNNASSNIQRFIDLGDFIQWMDLIQCSSASGIVEDIKFCSPLARQARANIRGYVAHPLITQGYPAPGTSAYVDDPYVTTVELTLQFCSYNSSLNNIYAVGYKKY